MKNPLRLGLVIVFSIIVGFYSAFSLSQIQIKTLKIEEIGDEANQKDFFADVVARVKKDYVEEKTDKQLYELAANGLLSSLDPHSSYLNEDGLKEMQVQTTGEFGGLGIEITMEYQLVKIVTAIEDTPAFTAGIKSGDYVAKIDGKTVVGLSIEEVVKKLRGRAGTKVVISILRKGEKGLIDKTIKREIIKVKAVKYSQFGDVAYVKINTFSQQAHSGLVKSIKKLKSEIGEKNIKGLVLDLRNNPGGLLDEAVKISEEFLDKNKMIVSISGRKKADTTYYKDEADEALTKDLSIVVLINEGSASASEIVAGALQDNKRAVIMGVKSFGKGSVQSVIPLSKNNGALRLTTALYYTPSGKSIQAHGIEPDILVETATITKEEPNGLRDAESDLKGHLKAQIEEEIQTAKKGQIKDDNFELYAKDYQLARAIDLIRGLSVYKNMQ